jgi:hypothetical protein
VTSRIYSLDEPYRPPPGDNNLWFYDGKKDQVIVFVHGILSDSHGCWYRGPTDMASGVYWPGLVRKDPRFSEFSIYLGGYSTDRQSGQYEVSDCAQELYDALRRPDEKTGSVVLNHKTIVFVCHSMGGIVVPYMLTVRPWAFRDPRIAVALIATPSHGSRWADRLALLVEYFGHEQGVQLRWGNWNLKDLDGRFRTFIQERGIPHLFGAEACENQFVLQGKWQPRIDPVVPKDSVGGYFGRVRMLPKTDHFTCVKPDDTSHPAHEFLVDFCRDLLANDAPPRQPTATASSTRQVESGAATPPLTAPPVCEAFHWDIGIDEEGDAYNEMTYEGVAFPAGRSSVFGLPPGEVQSGHTTPYELIRDSRTSVGITLEDLEVANPTKIRMQVKFTHPPTRLSPANFCLASRDWNVFAMNMEEYRQKPGWREDGLDFAEKFVPEAWGALTVLVRFPEQMIFAKIPFFEIYEPSESFEEKRNDELTVRYQHCFYYSRALRQAVLWVSRPPAPFSYRVSWLIGESWVSVTSALVPRQRQKQRNFSQKLLRMRKALNSAQGDMMEAQRLENVVNSTLATVAEYVQKKLGEADPLDPATLELSLMVLDEDNLELPVTGSRKLPVLRIVAGTRLEDPLYRYLALFVGDGNAGRAWKRRMARVFDDTERDPKRHIYVPIPKVPRHRFLVSVPLIDRDSAALVYGILNVGTFSDRQAEVLRLLGTAEQVEGIAGYAQSYVLTRLLEELKI